MKNLNRGTTSIRISDEMNEMLDDVFEEIKRAKKQDIAGKAILFYIIKLERFANGRCDVKDIKFNGVTLEDYNDFNKLHSL